MLEGHNLKGMLGEGVKFCIYKISEVIITIIIIIIIIIIFFYFLKLYLNLLKKPIYKSSPISLS